MIARESERTICLLWILLTSMAWVVVALLHTTTSIFVAPPVLNRHIILCTRHDRRCEIRSSNGVLERCAHSSMWRASYRVAWSPTVRLTATRWTKRHLRFDFSSICCSLRTVRSTKPFDRHMMVTRWQDYTAVWWWHRCIRTHLSRPKKIF